MIDPSEVQLFQKLGSGKWATVYRAILNAEEVAVKTFNFNNITPTVLTTFHEEVKMLAALDHPNVMMMVGMVVAQDKLWILTEFAANGDLHGTCWNAEREEGVCARGEGVIKRFYSFTTLCVRRFVYCTRHTRTLIHMNDHNSHNTHTGVLTRDEGRMWAEDVDAENKYNLALDGARGIAYMHAGGKVHRDLKPHNLLLDSRWTLKCADFGISKCIEDLDLDKLQLSTFCGTLGYVALEQLKGQKYSAKVDSYVSVSDSNLRVYVI